MPAPKNFKGRPGSKSIRQFYWPRCSVCQFMKNNPEFRTAVMNSSYFKPDGHTSLLQVLHDYNDPLKISTVYLHMQRHQEGDLMLARKRFGKLEGKEKLVVLPSDGKTPEVVSVVEGEVLSRAEHELGLDEFIRTGRALLQEGRLTITATTYLQAIKTKAEIEKNTKDRRLDAIKSFFAAPKGPSGDGTT